MKVNSKVIRLIVIVIIGTVLTYLTYQSKFSTFIFDLIIFGIISVIGLSIWVWALLSDTKRFRILNIKSLLTPTIGLVFVAIILTLNLSIKSTFDKPTLLKIFYDGDFNGTGIDFKTDGTYIFDNSAIGLNEYEYGTYKIEGDLITLDKNKIDNIIKTDRLEVRTKEIKYSDGIRKEKYAFQVNKNGDKLDNETEFRVIIDNRNE
ncbi:MAG: hypothetical protein K8R54_04600 [Bacteroidales bacterium]|nr:hypothetical protein [Bacteroidales bacterium]